MKNSVFANNSSAATGVFGVGVAKKTDPDAWFALVPSTPQEWLIFLSTCVILCQLAHWGYRFITWRKKRK